MRLSGQDTRRGTFVQRHASIVDAVTGEDYLPLSARWPPSGGRFFAYDSLLSEFAAMGFEYGYSVENPDALVLWEAQFGDFVNGAQSIVDEFISSGEVKWGQRSSRDAAAAARRTRARAPTTPPAGSSGTCSCAPRTTCGSPMPTTPANYFHLLRRQALSPKKKPLVVFTPKSLLRHKLARLVGRRLHHRHVPAGASATRVNGTPARRSSGCCSAPARSTTTCSRRGPSGASPTPRSSGWSSSTRCRSTELKAALAAYPDAEDFAWVQEEPANQGAWSFIALNLLEHLDGRPAAPDLPPGGGRAGGRLDEDARRRAGRPDRGRPARPEARDVDVLHRPGHRGAGRAARRREVTLEWLAERLRDFVDLNPEFETPIERFATWLARLDDDDDE